MSSSRIVRLLLVLALGSRVRGAPGQAARLRDMLQEVGELMQDTRDKLRGAAREMDLAPVRKAWDLEPKDERNQSSSGLGAGELKARARPDTRKDCIVDEDCRVSQFCQTDPLESECLSRRAAGENCTRDGQCYRDHLCIWGQCKANAERGELGSICEQQRDCGPHTCCAFHTDVLFPVCAPLAEREQACHDPTHQLLDLVTWEMELDGALDRCPCARGLLCLPEGNTLMSVCKDHKQAAVTKDLSDHMEVEDLPFLGLITHGDPGESYNPTAPDKEEAAIQTAESAMLDSIKDLHDWENPEGIDEYEVVWEAELGEAGRAPGADSHN